MALTATIAPSVVTWNANTWNATNEGPIRVDYQHSSQAVESRTGADEYPQDVFLVSKGLTVSVTLRNFCDTTALDCGTTSNIVVTLLTCGGTSSCTFSSMLLIDVSGSQDKNVLSEKTLTFLHLSSDGTTVPVS